MAEHKHHHHPHICQVTVENHQGNTKVFEEDDYEFRLDPPVLWIRSKNEPDHGFMVPLQRVVQSQTYYG